jgi:hypothetical protein
VCASRSARRWLTPRGHANSHAPSVARRLQSLGAKEITMSHELTIIERSNPAQQGKVGYALAWLLGIPLPVLLVIYLLTHH